MYKLKILKKYQHAIAGYGEVESHFSGKLLVKTTFDISSDAQSSQSD